MTDWLNRTHVGPRSGRSGRCTFVEHDGKLMSLSEWAKHTGVKYHTLLSRLQRGVPFEVAISARDRTSRGSDHYRWAAGGISEKGGRKRALKAYPTTRTCESCGAEKAERHHKDDDTSNNEAENIAFLCRRCHMRRDGRLEKAAHWALSTNEARRRG